MSTVRRRIDITKLTGITISNQGYEFVLHVNSEDDYRLYSAKRTQIIQAICQVYTKELGNRSLLVEFANEKNLSKYRTKGKDLALKKANLFEEKALRKRLQSLDEGSEMRLSTQTMFNRYKAKENVAVCDFIKLRKLGEGSFGKVYLVKKIDNERLYAMKSISRELLVNKGLVSHAEIEKFVLASNESEFLVKLDYSFQTPDKIYFVIDYKEGGDLYERFRKLRRFSEAEAKFYIAEVILALEYLHSKDIIYRDLKPENVLIDSEGHICLTDFGTSKSLKDEQKETNTFIGTCDYMAPEIIKSTEYGKAVDWWSLGVFIYEILVGVTPFCCKSNDENKIMENILNKPVSFPVKNVILSAEAKDLITKLLEKDPEMRLGAKEVKEHEWFSDIDWNLVLERRMKAPWKPGKVVECNEISSLESVLSSEDYEGESLMQRSRISSPRLKRSQKAVGGGFQHFNSVAIGEKITERNH